MKKSSNKKPLASNRKAYHNYEISDKYVAGIVLKGYEVKSVKNSQVNLKNGYVRIEKGEAWLIDVNISLWRYSSDKDYDPTRRRKLLLKKNQISKLEKEQNSNRITIIPLKMFTIKGRVKVLIGVGKGRRQYDKRRKIKEKDQKRSIEQELSRKKRF